tara:strand:- start:669 stop:770 length:102 start_codon:yes stop_codon:yes gene_type:complete
MAQGKHAGVVSTMGMIAKQMGKANVAQHFAALA